MLRAHLSGSVQEIKCSVVPIGIVFKYWENASQPSATGATECFISKVGG